MLIPGNPYFTTKLRLSLKLAFLYCCYKLSLGDDRTWVKKMKWCMKSFSLNIMTELIICDEELHWRILNLFYLIFISLEFFFLNFDGLTDFKKSQPLKINVNLLTTNISLNFAKNKFFKISVSEILFKKNNEH